MAPPGVPDDADRHHPVDDRRRPHHSSHLSLSTSVSTVPVLRLVEHRSTWVRCSVVGGFPPPRLSLNVVSSKSRASLETVATSTSNSLSVSLAGSRPGFRRLLAVTERTVEGFLPTMSHDGGQINCQAAVPGLRPRTGSVGLQVQCTSNKCI